MLKDILYQLQLNVRTLGTVGERLSRLECIPASLLLPEVIASLFLPRMLLTLALQVIGAIEPLELQLRHAQDLVREVRSQSICGVSPTRLTRTFSSGSSAER